MDQRLVLIVDDDRDLGEVLIEVLESEGFRARLATSTDAALAAVAMELPGVVLLDWNLGGGEPETLARELGERGVPIILSSGDEHADESGRSIGARAVLHKPFSLEVLLALVTELLPPRADQPPTYS